jgi:hypothetical protein
MAEYTLPLIQIFKDGSETVSTFEKVSHVFPTSPTLVLPLTNSRITHIPEVICYMFFYGFQIFEIIYAAIIALLAVNTLDDFYIRLFNTRSGFRCNPVFR